MVDIVLSVDRFAKVPKGVVGSDNANVAVAKLPTLVEVGGDFSSPLRY